MSASRGGRALDPAMAGLAMVPIDDMHPCPLQPRLSLALAPLSRERAFPCRCSEKTSPPNSSVIPSPHEWRPDHVDHV